MSKITDLVRPLVRSSLTGGGAGALDAVVTVGLTVPITGIVLNSNIAYIYQLQAGTNAESSPDVIRPDDYAASTNEKVWILQAINVQDASTIAKGIVQLAGDLTGTAAAPEVYKASKSWKWTILTPASFSSQQDDYAPTSHADCVIFHLTNTNFGGATITGLAGGAAGRMVILRNAGTFSITLADASSSSLAANRFALNGHNFTLATQLSIMLYHDGTNWKAIRADLNPTNYATYGLDLSLATNQARVNGANAGFSWKGVTTPAQWTSNQTAYSISNFVTHRVSTDAVRSLQGMQGGSVGVMVKIQNVGSFNITLEHESGSASAANQLDLGAYSSITLPPDSTAEFIYDATTSKWRLMDAWALALSGGTVTGNLTVSARFTADKWSNTQSSLSYSGTTDLDFDGVSARTLTLTGNVIFTTSNRAAGRMMKVKIEVDDSNSVDLQYPSTWIGISDLPVTLQANEMLLLSLECWGSNDSDITAVGKVFTT